MNIKKSLSAKKSLGQNFLKSKKAIKQMIMAANIKSGDVVVEIGPGKGVLTQALLDAGAKLIAFELDGRMIDYLEDEFQEYIETKQLKIIHKDILEIDIKKYVPKNNSYKLIANIPYYITNAILRKFLETKYQPSDIVLLVQKELAERIVVRDGKQSILALAVAVFGDVKYIAKVDRKYFSPSPKVHSAIIHISNISFQKIGDEIRQKLFFNIIRTAFSHKRKKCINNLEKIADKKIWHKIFSQLTIDENIRAEEIDLPIWISLLDTYQEEKSKNSQ